MINTTLPQPMSTLFPYTTLFRSREDVSKVAVFHNHPSGKPEPSLEDMNVTKGLKKVSEKLDIQLLDHFIVGKRNVFSIDRKSTRLNSSHVSISYAVFCLKKKKKS